MPGEEAWAIKCYSRELGKARWLNYLPSFLLRWF